MFKHELRIILVLYRIYFLSLLINIYLNRSIFFIIFRNIFKFKLWSASKSKYQKLENCRFRSSNMFNFRSYIPYRYKKIVCFSKNTCVIISQSWGRITALVNNKNKKKTEKWKAKRLLWLLYVREKYSNKQTLLLYSIPTFSNHPNCIKINTTWLL